MAKKFLIPLAIILLLVLGGLFLLKKQVQSQPGAGDKHAAAAQIGIGSTVPNIDLKPIGKPEIKLSDLKAKVYLINFWATWCEACVVEMPSIVRLYDTYKTKGLEVVSVSVDENPESVVPNAVSKFKMTFPIFTDTQQKLAEIFDVHGIPLSIVLDANRNILQMDEGERDWNSPEFRAKLDKWLGG